MEAILFLIVFLLVASGGLLAYKSILIIIENMVEIEQLDHNLFSVNGKLIQKDMNGNWQAIFGELTPKEHEAFVQHLNQQNRILNRLN